MRTPEELLCSRKWRIAHSSWMLLGFFPFAVLAWVGYLIIGIKARNWKWLVLAAVFLGWVIGWFAWTASWGSVEKYEPHPDPVSNAWWGWTGILVWLGNAFVLQWIVNRRWLVWRAHYRAEVWYKNATATRTTSESEPRPATPSTVTGIMHTALEGGREPAVTSAYPSASALSGPQYAAQPDTPGSVGPTAVPPEQANDVLDLNTATSDDLARLPGIDSAWADHIIRIRQQLGGFKDSAQLVTAASLQPHIFAALRGRFEVRTPPDGEASPHTPSSGRRLEF